MLKSIILALSTVFILYFGSQASAAPHQPIHDDSGREIARVINSGGKEKLIVHKQTPPKKKTVVKKSPQKNTGSKKSSIPAPQVVHVHHHHHHYHEKDHKGWNLDEANKAAIAGFAVGGAIGAFEGPPGAAAGAALGGVGGYLNYTFQKILED